MLKIAYLVSHPIHYQAPLLRLVAAQKDIQLHVFFCSNISVGSFSDKGFGMNIHWDTPLMDGYTYDFLPAFGRSDQVSLWRPFNYGLMKRLRSGGFDVLWVHGYARWFNLFAMVNAKRLGMKVLIRDEATAISTPRGRLKVKLKRLFFAFLKHVCDGFLFIGQMNRQYYMDMGVPQDKLFRVPYAVDNEFFRARASASESSREELRRSLRLERGRPIILYASKLTQRKRPSDLLEAYALLSNDRKCEPKPYLLFIGEGEMRPLLEQRTAEFGWSSIRFLGFKNQTDLPRYHNLCDVFVLPSVHEPWGLVINEVMNAGKALIVSDQVGSASDLVENGKNGFVYPAGNLQVLAERLRDLTSHSELAARMGRESLVKIDRCSFAQDLIGLRKALKLTPYQAVDSLGNQSELLSQNLGRSSI